MLLLWLILLACLGYSISIVSLVSITMLVCTISTTSMVCLVSSLSLIGLSSAICVGSLLIIATMIFLTFVANLIISPTRPVSKDSKQLVVRK